MTSTVPDGPDTELAAANDALSYLDAYARSRDHAHSGDARRWVEAVRAVLARPAAGRDLTAEDVQAAMDVMLSTESLPERRLRDAAGYLNRIVRPAAARTDGQPLTKPNPLRTREDWRRAAREDAEAALQETLARSTYRTDGQPPADDDLPTAAAPWTVTLTYAPGQNAGAVSVMPHRVPLFAVLGTIAAGESIRATAVEWEIPERAVEILVRLRAELESPSAAPADDGATPDTDHTTEHRAVMSGYGTGARGDLNMLRRVYRPQIEAGEVWIESRAVSPWTRMPDAGQPVRGSQTEAES